MSVLTGESRLQHLRVVVHVLLCVIICSCIFHPSSWFNLVLHFPVLHFPPNLVLHFPVLHFPSSELELLKNNWGVDHRLPKSRVDSTLWSTEGRKIYWGLNPQPPRQFQPWLHPKSGPPFSGPPFSTFWPSNYRGPAFSGHYFHTYCSSLVLFFPVLHFQSTQW